MKPQEDLLHNMQDNTMKDNRPTVQDNTVKTNDGFRNLLTETEKAAVRHAVKRFQLNK